MSRLALYESLKRQWILCHPNSTPEEYQRAIFRIARLCKV